MRLEFYKYQGTGNDFVIIDNRKGNIELTTEQIHHLCDRRFGIGADGLMFLNVIEHYDFEMKYYNADGKEGTMCGNGGRCLTRFAYDMGIKKEHYHFWAIDGEHKANLVENKWIHLQMKDVDEIHHHHGDITMNTGSPHLIKQVADVDEIHVFEEGRAIRYSKEFEADGININFVQSIAADKIKVRTYERGVENETLSCGTGVTASALAFAHNDSGFNRIEVQTLGGDLAVEFEKKGEHIYKNIWLCGPATFVFKGEIEI